MAVSASREIARQGPRPPQASAKHAARSAATRMCVQRVSGDSREIDVAQKKKLASRRSSRRRDHRRRLRSPMKLSAYLRAVPLARRTPAYYGAILAGDAAPCVADENAWNSLKISSVLELGAGQTARWTQSVAALGGARRHVAADLAPPACDCAQCVTADNRDLGALASAQAPFDLVYGAHVLCTCAP